MLERHGVLPRMLGCPRSARARQCRGIEFRYDEQVGYSIRLARMQCEARSLKLEFAWRIASSACTCLRGCDMTRAHAQALLTSRRELIQFPSTSPLSYVSDSHRKSAHERRRRHTLLASEQPSSHTSISLYSTHVQ